MKRLQIRRAIAELVESRMFDLGTVTLSEVWFEDPLCPLINPMCPDDLCWLPMGHPGTAERYHVLGTTPYDCAEQWPKEWLQDHEMSRVELYELGWAEQRRMFPDGV